MLDAFVVGDLAGAEPTGFALKSADWQFAGRGNGVPSDKGGEFDFPCSPTRRAGIVRVAAARELPGKPRASFGNQAMIAAIVRRSRDLGLRVSNISTYYMRGDVTLADLAPVIEATAEIGSDLIVANCHDPDYCRYLANLADYCEAAAPYGIRLVVEW